MGNTIACSCLSRISGSSILYATEQNERAVDVITAECSGCSCIYRCVPFAKALEETHDLFSGREIKKLESKLLSQRRPYIKTSGFGPGHNHENYENIPGEKALSLLQKRKP